MLYGKHTFSTELSGAVWARESTEMALQRQIVDSDYLVSFPGQRSVNAADFIDPQH